MNGPKHNDQTAQHNESGANSTNSASAAQAELAARAFALFSASMTKPGEQRESWLRSRCGDDAALWAELERLMQAERDSSRFLEAAPLWQPMQDYSGEQVGAFELIRLLARGGMGAVYLGRRNDGTYEQQVAVKLFDPRSLSAASRSRFITERKILAALEHPGIARVIDGGETAAGIAYLVMELVQGEIITRYCEQHLLGLSDRLQLLVKLCEALDYAHRCGIVHRDIKAANVLVTEHGEPKLIDFGIARMLQPAADDTASEQPPTSQLTSSLMTPEYASPEQLRGTDMTAASDIYSLGVLMYELLTGSRPHQLAGLSAAEMERAVCQTVPQDPSRAVAFKRTDTPLGLGSKQTLQRYLRGDLDRIVMTTLRQQPTQRYASAAALASDIRRYFAGQPVAARGASRLYRVGKFVQRHRPVVMVTLAAFALLLLAIMQLVVQVKATREQRDIAIAEAHKSSLATEFLTDMIAQADPFENASEPTLAGALRQSIAEIDQRFADQPELEADMRYAVGYALQNLGEIAPARAQLERVLTLRRQGDGAIKLAAALDAMGIICWWESDFACAESYFTDALDTLQQSVDSSADALAVQVNVLANRSAMLIDQGDYASSLKSARRALQLARQHAYDDAETLAAIWLNLATSLEAQGQDEQALAAFQNALELQQNLTGRQHPSYAVILNNLALYHHKLEQYDKAAHALTESVSIRRQTLGDNHPQTATALFNLARVQIKTGDLQAALLAAQDALQVAAAGYPENHPRIGKAHEALALVYQARQEQASARQHAKQAAAIYAAAPDVDPAWVTSINQLLQELNSG